MGDSVNQASRLEGANKNYGTRLLIDHDTFILAATTIEAREIDTITVMGRLEPMGIYELVATAGNLSPVVQKMFERYAEGLDHYRKADWAKAEHALRAALEIVPGDGPSTAMLSRIKLFYQEPPTEWDGVWHNTSK
jgi:adenylate cyclase